MITLGIDDAGRGPLIGPMILAGVVLDENGEEFLKNRNVRDSKTVTQKSRVEMAEAIKSVSLGFEVVETSAPDIDKSISEGVNLNTLEAIKTAAVINALNDGKKKMKVVVDCPSVNTVAWRATLLEYIEQKNNLDVICEHKADANHISVSAASILAKVRREEAVAILKERYGNIGSGYPADPFTKKFLQERGKELRDSGIFRKSWSTWKNVFPDDAVIAKKKGQSSLGDF